MPQQTIKKLTIQLLVPKDTDDAKIEEIINDLSDIRVDVEDAAKDLIEGAEHDDYVEVYTTEE